MFTTTITHIIEKLTDIFGENAIILKVTNGDWSHTILCECKPRIIGSPSYVWEIRDCCDRSHEYVIIDYALVSYWQTSRRNNENSPGFAETMTNEILPYLYENHHAICEELRDAIR